MELYILNEDFVAVDVIDTYESLIWTDRYLEPGDFELYLVIGTKIPSSIKIGRYMVQQNSEHVMIIEKLEIKTDVDDGNKLIVTGRSAESLLDRRVLYEEVDFHKDNGENLSVWLALRKAITHNLTLADVTQRRFLNPKDPWENIDGDIRYHSLFDLKEEEPGSDILKILITEEVEFYTGHNLLDLVVQICKYYNLGFKVIFDKARTKFIMSFYLGVDHTDRTKENYVIFSAKYDNLLESNYYNDIRSYKNVALCEGPEEDKYDKVKSDEIKPSTSPKEEGWYKYIDNEYVQTEDEEVRSDIQYYMKDGNVKTRVRGVAGNKKYMDRREMYVDCSSAQRIGDVTYDEIIPSEYPNFGDANPKEEGWYKYIIEHNVGEYVKTQDEEARYDVPYYAKNDHMKSDDEFKEFIRNIGFDTLSENKREEKFEGELQYRNVTFRYGVKYKVGDIVDVMNEYGFHGKARVTEYTFSHSVSDGERHYPIFESIEEG